MVAIGSNGDDQSDVADWNDIVSISAGHSRTVGLTSNGSVRAVGSNEYGELKVSSLTDIKLPGQ